MKIIFYSGKIEIANYPFSVCSRSRHFILEPKDIREVRTKRRPPEIVLHSGEIIFLDYASHNHLELFARLNSLPQVHRLDVWSLLSEPFLDMEFDERDKERTLQSLAEAGFTSEEVQNIRNKVRTRMLRFNSIVWEWAYFSHYDVLVAFGERNPIKNFLFSSRQKRFYDWCNEIANRAPETKELFADPVSRAELKLGDIAYELARRNSKMDFKNFQNIQQRLLDVIISSYTSSDRHYHNLEHALKVVSAVELYQGSNGDKLALKLAAWFHDIVYDARQTNNEEKSIERFEEITADTGLSPDVADRVKRLILTTKNHLSASTDLEKVMADADMLIFAEDQQTYERYISGVRKEYAFLDKNIFLKGRLDFLEKLQRHIDSIGHLYFTLHPMHEAQAKANIASEIAALQILSP
jgi:predicted metal-dependent HD superfamily phosphohydrolase